MTSCTENVLFGRDALVEVIIGWQTTRERQRRPCFTLALYTKVFLLSARVTWSSSRKHNHLTSMLNKRWTTRCSGDFPRGQSLAEWIYGHCYEIFELDTITEPLNRSRQQDDLMLRFNKVWWPNVFVRSQTVLKCIFGHCCKILQTLETLLRGH